MRSGYDKYKKYNDNELLYLISWHSEEALKILFLKYETLIVSKLKKLNLDEDTFNDFKQEAYMVIMVAVDRFDESYEKTFCRFFELLLDRRLNKLLIALYNYENKHFVNENILKVVDSNDDFYKNFDDQFYLKRVKELELNAQKKEILCDVMVKEESIYDYAKKHHLTKKQVYNQIYIIRALLKKEIDYQK